MRTQLTMRKGEKGLGFEGTQRENFTAQKHRTPLARDSLRSCQDISYLDCVEP